MIIAIDGPSGAGKSTIAKEIARQLNITYIDTGAMYRAVTLKVLQQKIPLKDIEKITQMLKQTEIDFIEGKIYLDGNYVEDAIRTVEVTGAVSAVSAMESVRQLMVEKQRKIADKKSTILDGRDIGTVVFPKADLKIYLTADVSVRAKRRLQENIIKGISSDYHEMEEAIRARDMADSTRELSPLKKAEDAIEIDTSHKTIGELTQEIIAMIEVR